MIEIEYTDEDYRIIAKMTNKTHLIVVIYDIVDNKKRYRVWKTLKGYGEWVQRSAFECHLTNRKYQEMIKNILPYFEEQDMLRIYKLTGQAEVKTWGHIPQTEDEDLIII